MLVRQKKNRNVVGHSTKFNTCQIDKVTVWFGGVGVCHESVEDLEVFLVNKNSWKSMYKSFADHDIIMDKYSGHFAESLNDEDRQLGYFT